MHGLRATAIFYPDFYPKTHRAGIETLSLFTDTSYSSRPENHAVPRSDHDGSYTCKITAEGLCMAADYDARTVLGLPAAHA